MPAHNHTNTGFACVEFWSELYSDIYYVWEQMAFKVTFMAPI